MKRVIFWLDVISPFAHLAFERLPQALEGCSVEVEYRPQKTSGIRGGAFIFTDSLPSRG